MKIGKHEIGSGRTFIIAEVAQAHDGSLSTAHAFVDAVATTGADAVKWQIHAGEPSGSQWRVKPLWSQDASRDAYWKRTCFSFNEWQGLAEHAVEVGLEFLCSPFSVTAVGMVDGLVPAWKVPSGQITNFALLDAVADTGKPILLSTGMATYAEIDRAVTRIRRCEDHVLVMHATSMYPTPAGRIGLNHHWRGLSDHSGKIFAGLAAVALGCEVLEVHVKLSEYDQGPDASSSLTVGKLAEMVEGCRFITDAKRPTDKDVLAEELEPMRRLFMGESRHDTERTATV